ncbi:unnamed protein product [Trichogramma brassicae]|uniref:CCHC-type domain-containing protein n=1 Tax=Trichogramma brassicae TaxID=86971 RepID=A0A6H5IKP6_9HYME|nr:unnamed protein product [Trichogramma brassicae]
MRRSSLVVEGERTPSVSLTASGGDEVAPSSVQAYASEEARASRDAEAELESYLSREELGASALSRREPEGMLVVEVSGESLPISSGVPVEEGERSRRIGGRAPIRWTSITTTDRRGNERTLRRGALARSGAVATVHASASARHRQEKDVARIQTANNIVTEEERREMLEALVTARNQVEEWDGKLSRRSLRARNRRRSGCWRTLRRLCSVDLARGRQRLALSRQMRRWCGVRRRRCRRSLRTRSCTTTAAVPVPATTTAAVLVPAAASTAAASASTSLAVVPASTQQQLQQHLQLARPPQLQQYQQPVLVPQQQQHQQEPMVVDRSHRVDRLISPVFWPSPTSEDADAPSRSVRGENFGGLEPVAFVSGLDPPRGACFNCHGSGHGRQQCWKRPMRVFCTNCGRGEVKVHACPRCGKAWRKSQRNWHTKKKSQKARLHSVVEKIHRR